MSHMIHSRIGITDCPAPRHQIMIAADRMKPGAFQPVEYMMRLRPTVHQITNGKQTIALWIKPDLQQCSFQLAETAVDITYRKIATCTIGAESLYIGMARTHAATGKIC